jgi:hypothetical protein
MSGIETFTGLSGDSEHEIVNATFARTVQVQVTTLPTLARKLSNTAPFLYKGLGWWQFYEHKGLLGANPDGYVLQPPLWIQTINAKWWGPGGGVFSSSGYDGFHLHVYEGGVVTIMFGY